MLPKPNRLTASREIERVVKGGRSAGTPLLGAKALWTGAPATRVAVVAGLRVHRRAVVRNRAKRLVREALRTNWVHIRPGFDVVIMVRSGGAGKEFHEIEEALAYALRKLGL